ncbi:MAG: hypothetical protein ACR2J7_03275 [Luteimonas sp.]
MSTVTFAAFGSPCARSTLALPLVVAGSLTTPASKAVSAPCAAPAALAMASASTAPTQRSRVEYVTS